MNRIARFAKISKKQFDTDFEGYDIAYEDIKLPRRATSGSAGYDIYSVKEFKLLPGETIKLPTGIRCEMDEDWVLFIAPRSGLGFKYRLRLENTLGVIDADYAGSDNEGHIWIKMTNCGNKELTIEKGQGIAQGIFVQYGITVDDNVSAVRNGGFGSTDSLSS